MGMYVSTQTSVPRVREDKDRGGKVGRWQRGKKLGREEDENYRGGAETKGNSTRCKYGTAYVSVWGEKHNVC